MSDEAIDAGADEVVDQIDDEVGEESLDEGAPAEQEDEVLDPRDVTAADPAKAAKPAAPRTYKVKVYGKDQEIPAEDVEKAAKALGVEVEALLGGTRMFKAANERFQKAAQIEKQARSALEALKTRPRDALREMLGEEDFAKLAIEAVSEMMQAEQLTPEQRRIKELEAINSKNERAAAELHKAREAEHAKQYETQAAKKLDTEITAALSSGKLPRDPYVVKRLATMIDSHLSRGGDPDELSFGDFIPLVQEEIKREHEAFLGALSGEDVIQRFPSLAEKVRKAYADRVSGRRSVPPVFGKDSPPRPRQREAKTYQSIGSLLRDW